MSKRFIDKIFNKVSTWKKQGWAPANRDRMKRNKMMEIRLKFVQIPHYFSVPFFFPSFPPFFLEICPELTKTRKNATSISFLTLVLLCILEQKITCIDNSVCFILWGMVEASKPLCNFFFQFVDYANLGKIFKYATTVFLAQFWFYE